MVLPARAGDVGEGLPDPLAASGVRPKVAQALMRHSSIVLTMDRYTHLSAEDERTALGSLPSLDDRGDVGQRATGTDGSACRVLAQQLSDDGQPCPTMANTNRRGATETLIKTRPAGLEPATPGLGNRCSIQLSYLDSRPDESASGI